MKPKLKPKLDYLKRSIFNIFQPKICPFCEGKKGQVIDRKYIFTSLVKCDTCHLNFRFPKDTKEFFEKFYQNDYAVDVHMITDLPNEAELQKLIDNNFSGLRNYTPYINALINSKNNENVKVVDYGCSWGYAVYQLKKEGFDAVGFELSIPRATFGQKTLGISIQTKPDDIRGNNDLMMSSHVIEHLSDIEEFVNLCRSKLKEKGIFMAFCPNGSKEFRDRKPNDFHGIWGLEHPNYLDVQFASYLFQDNPYLILTDDWNFNFEILDNWDGNSQVRGNKKDGEELLIIAKPNLQIN